MYSINGTCYIIGFTSVWLPQLEVLELKPTEAESETLGMLSCDQEMVTGPGETRAAVLE